MQQHPDSRLDAEVERRTGAPTWLETPPLRYPLFWLIASVAMIALMVPLGVMETPAPLRWITRNVNDKFLHVAAYAGLMMLLAQVLIDRRARLGSLLLLLAVGLGVELLQMRTATRQFELLDLLANSVGTLLAWWLVTYRMQSLLPRMEALVLVRIAPQLHTIGQIARSLSPRHCAKRSRPSGVRWM